MINNEKDELRQFYSGIRIGIELYAYTGKDGNQYIGMTPNARRLEDALKMIDLLEKGALGEIKKSINNEIGK